MEVVELNRVGGEFLGLFNVQMTEGGKVEALDDSLLNWGIETLATARWGETRPDRD